MIVYADPAAFDAAFCARLLPLLPPEKQAAAERIVHAPTKRETILAWALLHYALRLRDGEKTLPPLALTKTGKPYFPDAETQFNLSHTDTLVCAAVSDSPVGIDAQTLITPSNALAKRVLSKEELALLAAAENKADVFTTFWTQKEAFVKRTGEGIARGLGTLDFSRFYGADRFEAYDCAFQVFRLHGAILTACGAEALQTPQLVTREALLSLLSDENADNG